MPNQDTSNPTLENSTYEILKNRLQQSATDLRDRLGKLNEARKEVFGAIETTLIATERVHTAHNCIPYDMVPVGENFIFGYNVHLGLKSQVELSDVFSLYSYRDHSFHELGYDLISNATFQDDFQKLYKYYKDTKFVRFVLSEPFVYMVFQISKSASDIKAFKWEIKGDTLVYRDNRSEHEISVPEQHAFRWKRATRDDQRAGKHPHVSVADRVFVDTLNGNLTLKVEDNTDAGQGIYQEPVDNPDQTLDDAEVYYSVLDNLVLLKIRPYQEKAYRYLAYNAKLQEARRIDAIEEACIVLPDDQGILFPNGYYLQTGEFKAFEISQDSLVYEKTIASPNGEDFLYVFYNQNYHQYQLLPYNIINQEIANPMVAHGFAIFENGELCYFNADDEPKKHHAIRIWQTPFVGPNYPLSSQSDSFLYKVGNKDIVRAMAECQALLTLIDKGENYQNLYVDLQRQSTTLLDAYYWLNRDEAQQIHKPLTALRNTASAAIDEFEKVTSIRQNTQQQVAETTQAVDQLLRELKSQPKKHIQEFVHALARLREKRGEVISLKELRYVDADRVEEYEGTLADVAQSTAQYTVKFLLKDDSLAPFTKQVAEFEQGLTKVGKVVDIQELEKKIADFSGELEMLMEVVSNLKIEDATQTTQIIDRISVIFTELNKLKAQLKRKRKELLGQEGKAEFHAQSKLIRQALVNYLDVADTPEKTDEYLNKLMVQLEELEGKFAEFPEMLNQINELREEIYNAFESRKVQLIEARNQRANALLQAADRILKSVQHRLSSFSSAAELNGYFASDLMVEKVRSIVTELQEVGDTVKADDVESRLKSTREDALRQLKDRNELYVDGAQVIRLGQHSFSVNTAEVALTTVVKNNQLFYHITGTNFYEGLDDADINRYQPYWNQSLVSENQEVYRAEYLAYQLFVAAEAGDETIALSDIDGELTKEVSDWVQQFVASRYDEGYVKGVHDQDARHILQQLARIHQQAGLLRYSSEARSCALMCWQQFLEKEQQQRLNFQLKGAGAILQVFPHTKEFDPVLNQIQTSIQDFVQQTSLFDASVITEASEYLFYELIGDDKFTINQQSINLKEAFEKYLAKQKAEAKYRKSVSDLAEQLWVQYDLIRKWVQSFAEQVELDTAYVSEAAALLFNPKQKVETSEVTLSTTMENMQGNHPVIEDGKYELHYQTFFQKLSEFHHEAVPAYRDFQQRKRELTQQFTEELRLSEFKPRVMSSFVRNRLIDQVYLPLIGSNLAKQIGATGENKRTDLMGMLLLISPPGYGKTTLMEYLANRLGLVFMKINGPAIGHQVVSVDPSQAPNAGAREELEKLNLAFEMGDNVMIYLDDIQHCHPEFLQKFISLCDAQRKIEGVYKGRSKTYDFRGKKVCVVMAGNPYTESGDKFQIPDMLANRADIYNLGDIIGDSAEAFKLSYIENSLTSNPVLSKLAIKSQADVYTLVKLAQDNSAEGVEWEANHSAEEISEYITVMKKLITIRDTVLTVNLEYIRSAARADAYRTEPPFKLQGSYRDMNKMAEKVAPIMNEDELKTLINTHYENEAQTLTSGAEANLLKFKELHNALEGEAKQRWGEIKTIFQQEQRKKGTNGMGQAVAMMEDISESLRGIAQWLQQKPVE
ncbi:DNA repair ATPase [Tunicatimonas pelagia]|uniref:DNA repair ATPase n=1 Tax=Tunicatimonas pelagia TaxID=931531 RepID=UPI002666F08B|nr:DNA repair ATPase [Tunicatimonas pelagia]WKN43307.1 DNA repair ATPase [Tunicatimonas pelagia]